jgi:hypothetical protein
MSGLPVERLRSLLSYDPDTGEFWWRVNYGRVRAGDKTGCKGKHGYIVIGVDYKIHRAHRLAWAIHYGEWPTGFIDHINCDKSDNRIANLRAACHSGNATNRFVRRDNTSGHKGVFWHKITQKWAAQIRHRGQTTYLGLFADKNDAVKAYADAAAKLHGDFARVA